MADTHYEAKTAMAGTHHHGKITMADTHNGKVSLPEIH